MPHYNNESNNYIPTKMIIIHYFNITNELGNYGKKKKDKVIILHTTEPTKHRKSLRQLKRSVCRKTWSVEPKNKKTGKKQLSSTP